MKSLLMALVTTIMLPGMVVAADTDALIDRSSKAVLLLYSQNAEGGMTMHCTATTFDKSTSSAGYLLVSAAHCLGNDDTTKERAATGKNVPFFVTFDETAQIKKFYPVTVQWVGYQHRGEDFAVLEVHTDETWVTVPLGDEKTLKDPSPISSSTGRLFRETSTGGAQCFSTFPQGVDPAVPPSSVRSKKPL